MHIELRDIHKHFGSVKANNGVSLGIEPGEIHGIVGENGAGKSTLMKILAGYTGKSSGSIRIGGLPAEYSSPSQAAAKGIGMLYQDSLDFPALSVLDNYMLGGPSGLGRKRACRIEFEKRAREFGFNLEPGRILSTLTVGERQQLEILRLMSRGVETLILDEPTTGLSLQQKEALFLALKHLAAEGKSIFVVSHKLKEVEGLCDRITVLRQGEVSGAMVRPFDTAKLIDMMFASPASRPGVGRRRPGGALMALVGVSAPGGRTGLKNCSAEIREGEMIALAGLAGSGQGAFLRAAAGIQSPTRGQVLLGGRGMKGQDHHTFRGKGIAFLPSARIEEGLIPGLSLAEHYALQEPLRQFVLRPAQTIRYAKERIDRFRIKGTPGESVEALSGGNQQRLLLSFLPREPRLLLLENPTRGLDHDSADWVWHYLRTLCSESVGVVFSSSDLDEILMADRVLVFFDGEMVRDWRTDEIGIQDLGRAIAGNA